MRFDVGFILDWLKTTAASCIIRDGEMKLVELTTKNCKFRERDCNQGIRTIPLDKPKGVHRAILSP